MVLGQKWLLNPYQLMSSVLYFEKRKNLDKLKQYMLDFNQTNKKQQNARIKLWYSSIVSWWKFLCFFHFFFNPFYMCSNVGKNTRFSWSKFHICTPTIVFTSNICSYSSKNIFILFICAYERTTNITLELSKRRIIIRGFEIFLNLNQS